jgi:sporulation protein YlmC with PRC-barrel domain
MTTWSDVKGRKVVAIDSATTVGKLSDLVLDPGQRRIAALVLSKTSGKAHVLPWPDISAFGDDAVTIANEGVIVTPDERLARLADKTHSAHGKQVLSTEGVVLGEVKDLDFEPDSGTITTLILKDGEVTADHLIAVGSYAVIVHAPTPVV